MKPVSIGIDISLRDWTPEIKYVLRTLLRIAGLPYRFVWAHSAPAEIFDIYYGKQSGIRALISIRACERTFSDLEDLEPIALREQENLAFLDFNASESVPCLTTENGGIVLNEDIVFGSYWLLTGLHETRYSRDRWDNLDLEGSFFLTNSLPVRPLVSMYGAFLQTYFKEHGHQPLEAPWSKSFLFTHDVDYPQMIKWIECLRLAATRGWRALPSISGVLRGTNHFWTFAEWVDWEKRLGARSAFYFMARQGSLLQYALGTPDDFYDVRTCEFRDLFRYLQDEGFEIGLHASYNAWRDVWMLQREKERIEEVTGKKITGNRHHFWHLNPLAPNETLALHEDVELMYDSSLGLEYYPGFRRGICHPFRPYHVDQRREIRVVQLPPAWMDDHFDRRLRRNRISDPVSYSKSLVEKAAQTEGIIVADYHSRGMNSDFYPRYGPWIRDFVENHLDSRFKFRTAGDLVRDYIAYEQSLEAESCDLTIMKTPSAHSGFDMTVMQARDIQPVAMLHHSLFGDARIHGKSIATFGPAFLENIFYRLNLDNPSFFCDVARYRGTVIGFSVYSTQRSKVFRHMLRHKFPAAAAECFKLAVGNVGAIVGILKNLRYVWGERLSSIEKMDGWWIVAGVHPDYRTEEFKSSTGIHVASLLFDRMEETLRKVECTGWYGAVRPDNPAIKKFLQKRGAALVGKGPAQGLQMEYYIKTFRAGK